MESDYAMAGIPFDEAATRIRRLEEAIRIIKGMWTQDSTSLDGKYYRVKNLPKAVEELRFAKPRLMIGGGGQTLLKLAGRHADVANINGRLSVGDPLEEKRKLADRFGASLDEVDDCAWIMADEPVVVVEKIKRRFEDYGISHYIIDAGDSPSLEDLRRLYEKVIKPLS
jgi:alkanesulfonate monooxygenase SsuD/methylene tetrahydromethanopterin reductase-like flavin-dependent oxidoreductase (luciferase family)